MIPCLCFLRMALTYIVPIRYCMNRGSANGAPAGGAFLVDIPTEAVAEVRGPDELRLLIFPQPLDGALKNQNAAPVSPPCFGRLRCCSSPAPSNRGSANGAPAGGASLVDIPEDWEPRAKQQPTGLIAYGTSCRRPVRVLYRPPIPQTIRSGDFL